MTRHADNIFAAIDLGSHNCKLLIAHPDSGGFRVIDSFSRITRLGEGMSRDGALDEQAIERTIQALEACSKKIHHHAIRRVRGVATEACRRASNCEAFLNKVRAETGLDIEPIPAEEEARLTMMGCMALLHDAPPLALVFDIGGGSTEISWVERTDNSHFTVRGFTSLPVGLMDLAERFGNDIVSPDAYEAMSSEVAGNLAPFEIEHDIARHLEDGHATMLGTSGTVTMLGGIARNLPRYDRSKVDGMILDFETIDAISTRLRTMSFTERAAVPCIGNERAGLTVAGCAVLQAICRQWPAGRIRVADRGIREGLLMTMIANDKTAPDDTYPTPLPTGGILHTQ